jgi:hypothetical protein
MHVARLSVLALALALVLPSLSSAQTTDQELPIGHATTLRLNVSGSVHAIAVPGLQSVSFHVIDSGPSTPPMSITTSHTGLRMNVSITGPSQSVLPFGASGYELQVSYPAQMRLDLREFAGRVHIDRVTEPMQIYDANGNIVVDDARAALTAEDDNGNIAVGNARAMLMLTVGNGNVSAGLAPGWRGKLVRLEASNGNLNLAVPAGFAAQFDLSSAGGTVSNPLRSRAKGPLVFMLAEQGNVSIETR